MHERDQPHVRQLLLSAVGNGDLRRAFQRDLAVVRSERMGGEPVYASSSFHASDRCTPTIFRKGIGEAGSHGVGGIAPQVLAVIGPVYILLEVKRLDGHRVRPIG